MCSQFKITLLKVEPLWLSIYVEDQKSKQYRKAKESSEQLLVKQLAKDKELSEEEKIAMKKEKHHIKRKKGKGILNLRDRREVTQK